jgi:hypothetical protein
MPIGLGDYLRIKNTIGGYGGDNFCPLIGLYLEGRLPLIVGRGEMSDFAHSEEDSQRVLSCAPDIAGRIKLACEFCLKCNIAIGPREISGRIMTLMIEK